MSTVSRSSAESLVDRRANCGVEENCVRVMSKHLRRTADVRKIVNHEITSIPLATAGIVVLTTSDEVIFVMHQHECHRKIKTTHSSP